MARLTQKAREMLERGVEMEHMGGFYTADAGEYRVCERLREKGLLKFWSGRRSPAWNAQFFDITDAGRQARRVHT